MTNTPAREGLPELPAEVSAALDAIYQQFCANDNQDTPLERYPHDAVDALARAGWAVVPLALPFEVLGQAAIDGVFDTGNPKHGWDYLLARTRIPYRAALAAIAGREAQGHVEDEVFSTDRIALPHPQPVDYAHEESEAREDARLVGAGYTVDGVRVCPTRIQIYAHPPGAEQEDGDALAVLEVLADVMTDGTAPPRWCDSFIRRFIKARAHITARLSTTPLPVADSELPGMWSNSDFTGGDPDERSHAERTTPPPPSDAAQGVQAVRVDELLTVLDLLRTDRNGKKWDCIQSASGSMVDVSRLLAAHKGEGNG